MLLDKNLRNVQEHEIYDTGLKSLTFEVQCGEPYITVLQPENYIESADYSYVIKYVEYNDNNIMEISCKANIEDLEGCAVPIFDAFNMNVQQYLNYCVSFAPGWSVDFYRDRIIAEGNFVSPLSHNETTQEYNVNLFEMIKKTPDIYNSEKLWFDTKNKVIKVCVSSTENNDPKGYKKIKDLYTANKMVSTSGAKNTLDFATILYPIGKDGLTIDLVNPTGEKFIENYTYSNKRIARYLITKSSRVDVLYDKAKTYLARIAKPKTHYEVILAEPDDNIQIGNIIKVMDPVKGLRIEERIVAIHRFPYEPEQTTIEIGERTPDLSQLFIDNEELTKEELDEMRERLDNLTKT